MVLGLVLRTTYYTSECCRRSIEVTYGSSRYQAQAHPSYDYFLDRLSATARPNRLDAHTENVSDPIKISLYAKYQRSAIASRSIMSLYFCLDPRNNLSQHGIRQAGTTVFGPRDRRLLTSRCSLYTRAHRKVRLASK